MSTSPSPSGNARSGWWRRLGRGTVAHLPAVFAAGAVLIYLLGVVSTVGQLRATDVDVGRAMSLMSIEQHLRNGLGILVDPVFLFVVAVYGAMYAVSRATTSGSQPTRQQRSTPSLEGNAGLTGPARPEAPTETDNKREGKADDHRHAIKKILRRSSWGDRFFFVFRALFLLWSVVVLPWPFIILTAIVVTTWVLPWILAARLGGPWSYRRSEIYVAMSVSAVLLVAGLDAYFRSDPLPIAKAETRDRSFKRPMIAIDNGFVYFASTDENALYVAVPTTRVANLRVERQQRAAEPSFLNALGIDWPQDDR